jgi:predicted nucleotide-binding protein
MTSRMKIFIGSSRKTVKFAHALQNLIIEAGGPIVEVEVWIRDTIEPGATYVEWLLEMASSAHAILLLASGDDTVLTTGAGGRQARDNVLAEYGVCVKAGGPERTVLATLDPATLPANLGVNHIELAPDDDLDEFQKRNRLHVYNWLDTVLRLPPTPPPPRPRRRQARRSGTVPRGDP